MNRWTKRINNVLEVYLQHYVLVNQADWVKLLDVAQFCFNLQRNESINKSPFEIVFGFQLMIPKDNVGGYKGASHPLYWFAKDWLE